LKMASLIRRSFGVSQRSLRSYRSWSVVVNNSNNNNSNNSNSNSHSHTYSSSSSSGGGSSEYSVKRFLSSVGKVQQDQVNKHEPFSFLLADAADKSNTTSPTESPAVSFLKPMSMTKAMLDARVHLGHKAHLYNPKMAPHIAGIRSGLHIIDLDHSSAAMAKALYVLRGIASNGGNVVFVNTRKQFEKMTRRAATACGSFFVTKKWLGGTFTNSKSLLGENVKPDAVVLLSLPVLSAVLKEARQMSIPTIGIVDTDCDPASVDLPIPGNDDSEEAVKLYLHLMCQTILQGKAEWIRNQKKKRDDVDQNSYANRERDNRSNRDKYRKQ